MSRVVLISLRSNAHDGSLFLVSPCSRFHSIPFHSVPSCSAGPRRLLISASCARIVRYNASIPLQFWSIVSSFTATPSHHSLTRSNRASILRSLSSIRSSSPLNLVTNRHTSSRMSCTSSSSRNTTTGSCVTGTCTSRRSRRSSSCSLTSNEVAGHADSGTIEMCNIPVLVEMNRLLCLSVNCTVLGLVLRPLFHRGFAKRSMYLLIVIVIVMRPLLAPPFACSGVVLVRSLFAVGCS
ncbi:hypothetical protein HOY80DRAFT_941326 [Tuber brumale]|nr:hypothetical protein HOY80DRAFT_941326 [Tuber brumale]